jgi:uncharacterized membrane protein
VRVWLAVATLCAACGTPSTCPNDLPASCPSPAPHFAADVQPVLQARCVRCHTSGGQAGEKPLTTWAEIFGRRSSVLNRVYACVMPPAAEPQLTEAERRTLLGWLVCGAPDD